MTPRPVRARTEGSQHGFIRRMVSPANSSIVPAGLERAEKKYGRRISMADFSADEANWP